MGDLEEQVRHQDTVARVFSISYSSCLLSVCRRADYRVMLFGGRALCRPKARTHTSLLQMLTYYSYHTFVNRI